MLIRSLSLSSNRIADARADYPTAIVESVPRLDRTFRQLRTNIGPEPIGFDIVIVTSSSLLLKGYKALQPTLRAYREACPSPEPSSGVVNLTRDQILSPARLPGRGFTPRMNHVQETGHVPCSAFDNSAQCAICRHPHT